MLQTSFVSLRLFDTEGGTVIPTSLFFNNALSSIVSEVEKSFLLQEARVQSCYLLGTLHHTGNCL